MVPSQIKINDMGSNRDNLDEDEMTYWRHHTPIGVKVEEISGGNRYSRRVWEIMARQVWSENGYDGDYRTIVHADNGAPLLEDSRQRISISHTDGKFVVATLPATPGIDLQNYEPYAAMGIDTERADREITDDVFSRIFSTQEQTLIKPAERILGWVCKEALYKAALGLSKSWADDYTIIALPDADREITGKAEININADREPFTLYAWKSGKHIIAIALAEKSVTYKSASSEAVNK